MNKVRVCEDHLPDHTHESKMEAVDDEVAPTQFIDYEAQEVGSPSSSGSGEEASSASSGDEELEEEEAGGPRVPRARSPLPVPRSDLASTGSMKRTTSSYAMKQPLSLLQSAVDEEEDAEALGNNPDIGEYLSQFNLPDQSQISLCRTWANYLAAKHRPISYKKKARTVNYGTVKK